MVRGVGGWHGIGTLCVAKSRVLKLLFSEQRDISSVADVAMQLGEVLSGWFRMCCDNERNVGVRRGDRSGSLLLLP